MQCDQCSKEFIKYHKYLLSSLYHFCCDECVNKAMKKGGIVYQKMKSTWRQNGYEHPMCATSIQEKHKATCMKNFGVEEPFQMKHVRKRLDDDDVIQKKYETHISETVCKRRS